MNLNQYVSSTAAQPGLSVNAIINVKTACPPLEVQRKIADHLGIMSGQIDALIGDKQSLISELEAYKKSLIYEAVTGKIKVV